MVLIDLHVHTAESDGSLPVYEVLKLASECGIETLSLTDHETTHGVELAKSYPEFSHIDIIPGVELVTGFRGREVHLLGYFNESCLNNKTLQNRLKELRLHRTALAYNMVRCLQRDGVSLAWSEVEEEANPEGAVSKGHIMRAIFNHSPNRERISWPVIASFFQPGGVAYLPFLEHAFEEAVDLIYDCGGIPVLAHPGLLKDSSLVHDLLAYRPIGLEVYYGYWENHTKLIAEYEAVARAEAILATGGSDFHGPFGPVKIGQIEVPQSCLKDLQHFL